MVLVSIVFMLVFLCSANAYNCTIDNDCGHGKCRNQSCICDKGFTSFNNKVCNYEQKKKLTAFLLSFFVGVTGADWFYLANGNNHYVGVGVAKLILLIANFGFLCVPCIMAGIVKKGKGALSCVCGLFVVLLVLMSAANVIWALADWIRILANSFKDGNNVSLEDW